MRAVTAVWCLTVIGLLAGVAPAQQADKGEAKGKFEVKVMSDLAYTEKGKELDAERQQVDLYLPEGKKDFPVLVYVHGGGWSKGDRKAGAKVGKTLAGEGIGVVSVGYRLSPAVQHPAHVEDVAQAFAWTYQNIGKYGGNKNALFVSGHSAGGHLAALLATNAAYLKKYNLSPKNIKGCLPVSGVFAVGGQNEKIWGKDPEGWTQGSPLKNVSKDCPPFLIIYAEKDGKMFHTQAKELADLLKKAGVEATYREMEGRDHGSVISLVNQNGDATRELMLEFIKKHQ